MTLTSRTDARTTGAECAPRLSSAAARAQRGAQWKCSGQRGNTKIGCIWGFTADFIGENEQIIGMLDGIWDLRVIHIVHLMVHIVRNRYICIYFIHIYLYICILHIYIYTCVYIYMYIYIFHTDMYIYI